MWGIFWQAGEQLAFEEGFCFLQLSGWLVSAEMRNLTFLFCSLEPIICIQAPLTDSGALIHDTVPIGRLVKLSGETFTCRIRLFSLF